MQLHFIDFEVFKYNWLIVDIDPTTHTKTVIWDDPDKLEKHYSAHKNEIWVGYNIRRYDQYIFKGILLGMNPKRINDFIIMQHQDGWRYSGEFNKINMVTFDLFMTNDSGLKTLEAFMGNNIKETSVDFNIDRPLTDKEKAETEKYCTHDVEQSIEVFLHRQGEFSAAMGLVKIFKLPLNYIGKTTAQRVAAILGGKRQRFDDDFKFPIVDTLRLDKYAGVVKWYRNPLNFDYTKKLKLDIAGVPHIFAWGGIHGAISKYHGVGVYLMIDVTAYYPSLQLRYKLGYRNMEHPENFELIHKENLRFKALGDKVARQPYKIADNAISGQLKDPTSPLYDPRENNAVCVNGQLLLLDLIEKIEQARAAELIQSNTDGILLKMPLGWNVKEWYSKIDDIVWEWEKRTGMRMEFTLYHEVFQKDVNNYVIVTDDGHTKTKGKYTKGLSDVDYDLPIVNVALVDYMTKKIPVEQTINDCNDLRMFQRVVKLSGKYWRTWHNGSFMTEKCHRVFASLRDSDTYIGKCKGEGMTIEKFADTPTHCFIENGAVRGVPVPAILDRQWYIDLANKRLEQYGVAI